MDYKICYYCEEKESTITIDDLNFCDECSEYINNLKSDKDDKN